MARTAIDVCPGWNTAEFFETVTAEGLRDCLASGASIEARNKFGATPLHFAAAHGTPDVIRALVDSGANIEARSEDGATPLHEAAAFGTPEAVKALLDAGAKKKARTSEGDLPADLAVENEKVRNHPVFWVLNEARYD